MSSDWQEFQLGSRCSVKSSKRIFAEEYVEDGIPFFRSKDVIDKSLGLFSGYDLFISEARYREIKEKFGSPVKGDLLISSVGNRSGQPYVVQDEGDFYFKDGNILWLSDFKDINPEFLAYWFKSEVGQSALASVMIGSAQKALTIDAIRKLWVNFPSIDYQDYAANVLKTLDEKIQISRQINQTLEQIAQAIFKSWFVYFEPVKAKIEAKQNGQDPERAAMRAICGKTDEELDQLNSEQRQQFAATAALFPDELVGSELGEIPKGWEVINLGSITSELRRGISPKYIEEGGVRVINQKCIRNHTIDFTLCRRHDSAKLKIDGRELQVGDVLVNSTGVGTLGRLAPVRYLLEVTIVDSHVTVIRGTDGMVTPSFLAGLMLTKEALIESSGAGSTGQTELSRQVLAEISLCKPTYKIQEVFEQIIEPTHGLIAQNELQQFALLAIREALLPKLLSGDLTVEPLQASV